MPAAATDGDPAGARALARAILAKHLDALATRDVRRWRGAWARARTPIEAACAAIGGWTRTRAGGFRAREGSTSRLT